MIITFLTISLILSGAGTTAPKSSLKPKAKVSATKNIKSSYLRYIYIPSPHSTFKPKDFRLVLNVKSALSKKLLEKFKNYFKVLYKNQLVNQIEEYVKGKLRFRYHIASSIPITSKGYKPEVKEYKVNFTKVEEFQDGKLLAVYNYSDGLLSKIIFYENGKPTSSVEYNYNKKKQITQELYYDEGGSLVASKEYTYTPEGYLKRVVYKKEGNLIWSREYIYNPKIANGNPIQVIHTEEGMLTYFMSQEFDRRGRLLSRTIKKFENLVLREAHYYNAKERTEKIENYDEKGEMQNYIMIYYDAKGNIVKKIVYKATGEMATLSQILANISILTSEAPSIVYPPQWDDFFYKSFYLKVAIDPKTGDISYEDPITEEEAAGKPVYFRVFIAKDSDRPVRIERIVKNKEINMLILISELNKPIKVGYYAKGKVTQIDYYNPNGLISYTEFYRKGKLYQYKIYKYDAQGNRIGVETIRGGKLKKGKK